MVEVSNRFEALQKCSESESVWNTFKVNVLTAATEVVGFKQRKKKEWISNQTFEVIEQRRRARLRGDITLYRQINKQHNSMLHRDKKDFIEGKAAELDQAIQKKYIGATFKILRELTGQHNMASTSLKAANRETIYDQSQCLGLWKQHFDILLNSDPPDSIDPGLVAAAAEATAAPDGDEFSPEEIRSAVKKLKNKKAAGTCGIVSELLTTGSPAMILRLKMVFSIIWRTEVILSDWKKGILVPVFKHKGSKTDYNNYRGITLLSVPGKLFAMLLLKRATSFLRTLCRPQQAGFMQGRSTTEQIHTVRQIVEKTVEFIKKVHIAFIDFRSTFDTVDRLSFWLILKAVALPAKIVSLFK